MAAWDPQVVFERLQASARMSVYGEFNRLQAEIARKELSGSDPAAIEFAKNGAEAIEREVLALLEHIRHFAPTKAEWRIVNRLAVDFVRALAAEAEKRLVAARPRELAPNLGGLPHYVERVTAVVDAFVASNVAAIERECRRSWGQVGLVVLTAALTALFSSWFN